MWRNPQQTVELVTFTEEIFNGRLHFLCSVWNKKTSDDIHWNVWTNITKFFLPIIYLKKTNYKYELWNNSDFGPNFLFWKTALGRFS